MSVSIFMLKIFFQIVAFCKFYDFDTLALERNANWYFIVWEQFLGEHFNQLVFGHLSGFSIKKMVSYVNLEPWLYPSVVTPIDTTQKIEKS